MAYQGLITPFPLGVEGLVGDPDTDRYGSLVKADNIRFDGQRVLRDDHLVDMRLDLISEGPIVGLASSRIFGDDGLIVARGSYIRGPSFNYPLGTFLPNEASVSLIKAGKENQGEPPKIFVFSPTSLPVVVKNNSPQVMDEIPPEWKENFPTTGFVHRNRLIFIAGHNAYYSDPATHERIFVEVKRIEIKRIEIRQIEVKRIELLNKGKSYDPKRYKRVKYGASNYDEGVSYEPKRFAEIRYGESGYEDGESFDTARYDEVKYGENGYDSGISYNPKKYEDVKFDDENYNIAESYDKKRYSFYRSAGVLPIYPGEGNQIIAGISFRGIAVIFKYPRGIYTVKTETIEAVGWSVQKLSEDLGCVSPQGLVAINNDVLFMDLSGHLHLLSAVNTTGDLNASNLTRRNQLSKWVLDNMDLTRTNEVRMAYDSVNSEANIIYPHKDGNNYRLIVDFSHRNGPRFRENRALDCSAIHEYQETATKRLLLVGDKLGRVLQVYRRTNPIEASGSSRSLVDIQTPWFTFDWLEPALNFVRKTLDFIELEINYLGHLRLSMFIEADRKRDWVELEFNNYGGFFLGRDRLGLDPWSNVETRTSRFKKRIGLSGTQFRITLRDNGSSDFEIVQTHFRFRASGNPLIDDS